MSPCTGKYGRHITIAWSGIPLLLKPQLQPKRVTAVEVVLLESLVADKPEVFVQGQCFGVCGLGFE
jgi:hypothetical protein